MWKGEATAQSDGCSLLVQQQTAQNKAGGTADFKSADCLDRVLVLVDVHL